MLSLQLGWEVLGAKTSLSLSRALGGLVMRGVGWLLRGVGQLGVDGLRGLVCLVEWPGAGIMLRCRRLCSER